MRVASSIARSDISARRLFLLTHSAAIFVALADALVLVPLLLAPFFGGGVGAGLKQREDGWQKVICHDGIRRQKPGHRRNLTRK